MKSFDNAFALLTDDAKEIENYMMRSKMMNAIVNLIEEREWTQLKAAEELGVTQPRISNLKNGRISKFSVDMLMGMLTKLGYSFEFTTSPKRKTAVNISMFIENEACH
jgi:predicted XRE-type DNA-binding protein